MTQPIVFLLSGFLGAATGFLGNTFLLQLADFVAHSTQNILQLLSMPVIFFSIAATLSGMRHGAAVLSLGRRVLFYTLLTTIIAATVGAALFLWVFPTFIGELGVASASVTTSSFSWYSSLVYDVVPNNLITLFSPQGSVLSVVLCAFFCGAGVLRLPDEERERLHRGLKSIFALLLQLAELVLRAMPVAVWAFVTLCVQSLNGAGSELASLGWYVAVVLLANVLQGGFVLPLILKLKGLSPWRLLQSFQPALLLAFFSKSSNSTLPVTLECAQERAGLSPRVSNFTLPLCATINMNGCAAFILITILFVGTAHGMHFSLVDVVTWIVLATVAAVGNAGVPMGCFFLTSAFLVHLGLPLHMMGLILPVYTLIDMVETALNVWSDACVTALVDRDVTRDDDVAHRQES